MNHKGNAFDLLRILLAACVLVTHGLMIGKYAFIDPLAFFSKGQTDLAEFGVMGFFGLSGFLIAGSFDRAKNIFVYLAHRALRILPGFWTCLIITAFFLAPCIFLFSGRSLQDYKFFGKESATGYLLNNISLKINQWSIKDVLNGSVYQGSLDGSLWSLFPELQCYLFTLMAGAAGLFSKNKYLYLVFSTVIFAIFAIHANFSTSFGPTILTLSPALKLYSTYVAGTLIYVFRNSLTFDRKGTFFLIGFSLILLRFGGFQLVSPLLISMSLINLFQLFTLNFKYDLSYGIYIYSFVIQQLLFVIMKSSLPPTIFIGFSLIFSAAISILSFIVVERPMMNLRKKADIYINRLNFMRGYLNGND